MLVSQQDVLLISSFADKDRIKAVGTARWHKDERKWLIPAGQDLSPYSEWLPAGVAGDDQPVESTADRYGTSPDNAPQLTIAEFIDGVRNVILERYRSDVWLIGQVTSVRERKNVVLIELMDPDQSGASSAHRIEVKAFGGQFQKIAAKLKAVAGQDFVDGINVRIKVSPEFDPRYHLGARLVDIDPTVTIGAFELRLRQIREGLQRDGLYERNRSLPAPVDFCRIAVIHPHAASGLADFEADAAILERLGLCEVHYITATFEGANAEGSLVQALAQAEALNLSMPLDAIAVIRGGGSKQGLMALSTDAIARALCRMPVPVITGLGHADDDTLLDELAWRRCDTPSKVIAFVRDTIRGNAIKAAEAFARIHKIVQSGLSEKLAAADRSVERLRHFATSRVRDLRDTTEAGQQAIRNAAVGKRQQLVEQSRIIDLSFGRIQNLAPAKIQEFAARAERLVGTIASAAGSKLKLADAKLDENLRGMRQGGAGFLRSSMDTAEQRFRVVQAGYDVVRERLVRDFEHKMSLISLLGPDATVARGFVIAFDGAGKAITTAEAAARQDRLSLKFRDGSLDVRPM